MRPSTPQRKNVSPNRSPRRRSHSPAADAKNSCDLARRRVSTPRSRRSSCPRRGRGCNLFADDRPQPLRARSPARPPACCRSGWCRRAATSTQSSSARVFRWRLTLDCGICRTAHSSDTVSSCFSSSMQHAAPGRVRQRRHVLEDGYDHISVNPDAIILPPGAASQGVKLLDSGSPLRVVSLPGGRFRAFREPSVRVDDAVLRCVGFIGELDHESSDSADYTPYGTGFFVQLSTQFAGKAFHCFVTARHVVRKLLKKKMCVVINSRSEGRKIYELLSPQWWFHPTDKSADVAVMPFSVESDDDVMSVGADDLFLTDVNKDKSKIGVGDEVFITGLFSFATGEQRIKPIVRHGNIAMMPDEPIQTDDGYEEVYLIEARSIGGLSGSPVFVRETVQLVSKDKGGAPAVLAGLGRLQLLGMCLGHWDIKESDINHPRPKAVQVRAASTWVSGFVAPATKILETINQSELMEMRKTIEKAHLQELGGPVRDSALSPHERFQGLARRVVSVPRDVIVQRERAFKADRPNRPNVGRKAKAAK